MLGSYHSGFGQINSSKKELNRDISQTILKKDFDSLVDNSIVLLENKTLLEISDEQHIMVIMCLNTVFMRSFENGRYEKLELISDQKEYMKNIIVRYPDWTPNRGMGFFFPKLKMELYGTPMPYAVFEVIE